MRNDDLTLKHKKNQIGKNSLCRQNVGGFKCLVIAIELRLKPRMDP